MFQLAKTRKKIVVVGSVNVDFVVRAPRLPVAGETVSRARFDVCYGGKGGNQAVAAARLGAPTAMVAKVGEDEFGRRRRAFRHPAGRTAFHAHPRRRQFLPPPQQPVTASRRCVNIFCPLLSKGYFSGTRER
jgi:hypothetical protein